MIKSKWFAKAMYIVIALALVLGFAMVPVAPVHAVAGTWYVDAASATGGDGTTSATTGANRAFHTIADGITAASAGNTIIVAAGTYSTATNGEAFPINVNMAVIIRSAAGAATTIITPTSADLAAFNVTAAGATIGGSGTGFTITAGGRGGIYADVTGGSGIRVEGNTFKSYSDGESRGMYFDKLWNSAVITGNTFATGSYLGTGMEVVNADGATISNNTVAASTLKYCFLTFKAEAFIPARDPTKPYAEYVATTASVINNVSVTGNTVGTLISANKPGVYFAASTKHSDHGEPQAQDLSVGAGGVSITGNTFGTGQVGVAIDPNTTAPDSAQVAHITGIANILINNNNLSGSTVYGVYNGQTTAVNALHNWWGNVNGPLLTPPATSGADGVPVSTNVNYTPWSCAAGGADLTLAMDQACYKAGTTATITVNDCSRAGASVAVYAWSTTLGTPGTITIALTKTGTPFIGTMALVTSSPGPGQLLVSNGDTIYVKYYFPDSTFLQTTAVYDTAAPTGVGISITGGYINNANKAVAPVVITSAESGTYTYSIGGTITGTGSIVGATPASFTKDCSSLTDGPIALSVTVTDCATNSTTATGTATKDVVAPTVTINQAAGQADPTNASPINFTAVFSESVGTSFVSGEVALTGTAFATTATVTGSGATYNVAVSGMTTDGTVIATINAGVATDLAGNPNTVSTSTDQTVTRDTTAPTVTINQATGQSDPTDTAPINFTVTFNEPVTGFATGDVTLAGPGTLVGTVTGTGPYNVAVTGMNGTGTVTASIGGSKCTDIAGNNNAASTSTDNTVQYNQVNPQPTLTAAAGPFNANFTVTIDFDRDVIGFDTTDIDVGNGTKGTFTVVTARQYTQVIIPGPAQANVTVDVAVGKCTDGTGHPNLAATQLVRTFDNVAPTVVITAPLTAGPTWNYTATFSEAVTNFVIGDITGTHATIDTLAGGPAVYTFNVTANPTTDGTVVTVNIAAGVCQDAAGNLNTAAAPYVRTYFANSNTHWSIQLAQGWNLISLPLVPTNTDLVTALGTLSTNVNAVWYYYAGTPAGWQSWAPGLPSPTLTTLTDGKAYWFNMAAPGTLVITGTVAPLPPALPSAYNVYPGWNMIGFRSTAQLTENVYLAGVAGIVRIYRYDNATGYGPVTIGSPGGNMNQGEGFWLSTTTAGTIYP